MASAPTPEQIKAAEASMKRKASDRKKAEETAHRDALRKPQEVVVQNRPGKELTLHELNVQQRQIDREHRDITREAAIAAGKAVQQTLNSGVTASSVKISKRAAKARTPAEAVVHPGEPVTEAQATKAAAKPPARKRKK